jgi:hypothetical protein
MSSTFVTSPPINNGARFNEQAYLNPIQSESNFPAYSSVSGSGSKAPEYQATVGSSNFGTVLYDDAQRFLSSTDTIGLYHTNENHDYFFATKQSNPPLYYLTSVQSVTLPNIVLRSGTDPKSIQFCTARYSQVNDRAVEINLNPPPEITTAPTPDKIFKAYHGGTINKTISFSIAPHAQSSDKEAFEWRHSSSAEVKALKAKSSGLECVRVRTGEIVAVYADISSLMQFSSKEGKFRFVTEKLGDDVKKMALMILLSKIEASRRLEMEYMTSMAGDVASMNTWGN